MVARWRALESAVAPLPSVAEWERVWQGIATRSAVADRRRKVLGGRWMPLLRLLPPLAAAATIALLFGGWRWDVSLGQVPLAHGSKIEAIESFGGFMPVVVSTGGRDGIDVIWVVEDS